MPEREGTPTPPEHKSLADKNTGESDRQNTAPPARPRRRRSATPLALPARRPRARVVLTEPQHCEEDPALTSLDTPGCRAWRAAGSGSVSRDPHPPRPRAPARTGALAGLRKCMRRGGPGGVAPPVPPPRRVPNRSRQVSWLCNAGSGQKKSSARLIRPRAAPPVPRGLPFGNRLPRARPRRSSRAVSGSPPWPPAPVNVWRGRGPPSSHSEGGARGCGLAAAKGRPRRRALHELGGGSALRTTKPSTDGPARSIVPKTREGRRRPRPTVLNFEILRRARLGGGAPPGVLAFGQNPAPPPRNRPRRHGRASGPGRGPGKCQCRGGTPARLPFSAASAQLGAECGLLLHKPGPGPCSNPACRQCRRGGRPEPLGPAKDGPRAAKISQGTNIPTCARARACSLAPLPCFAGAARLWSEQAEPWGTEVARCRSVLAVQPDESPRVASSDDPSGHAHRQARFVDRCNCPDSGPPAGCVGGAAGGACRGGAVSAGASVAAGRRGGKSQYGRLDWLILGRGSGQAATAAATTAEQARALMRPKGTGSNAAETRLHVVSASDLDAAAGRRTARPEAAGPANLKAPCGPSPSIPS